tara:strand:- start:247 stop:1722 length:1476 start_codon:yes stop_codon:yes gene_type:complete
MPISIFSTGCNCDCCLVYESRYCEFIAENFPDDHATGGAFPVQGGALNLSGVFDDVENWTYQRDVCYSGLSDCIATTDTRSGLKYSADTYIKGIQSAGENANRAILVNPLDKFQWYTLMSFTKCETCTGDQTNALWFCFDYQDTDNWLALEIEYEPDFTTSPGNPDRIFLIRLWENVAGTIQLVDAPQSAVSVNLGAGANQVDIFAEINVDVCGGDDMVMLKIGTIGGTAEEVGYSITPINGGKIGWITRFASESEIGDAGCTVAGNGIYDKHQQIYKTAIYYLDSERTGCAEYSSPCCHCYTPNEYDITFSGFTDSECSACDEFNDTFSAAFFGHTTCTRDVFTPYNCCRWRFAFDGYSLPACSFYTENSGGIENSLHVYVDFQYIDLTAREISSGTIWELEILCNVIVYWADASGNDLSEEGRALCRLVWTLNDASWPPDCGLNGAESWSIISGCTQYLGDSSSSTWAANEFSLSQLCATIGTPSVEVG